MDGARKSQSELQRFIKISWAYDFELQCASIDARRHIFVFMCLGADIELSLAAKSASQTVQDDWHPFSSRIDVAPELLDEDLQLIDVMDIDDEEEIPLSLSRKRPATATVSTTSSILKRKIQRADDSLITLVHGDMLLLDGDEFEVSSVFGGTCEYGTNICHSGPSNALE